MIPPSVQHVHLRISLSAADQPLSEVLQNWDKGMNWTELRDVLRQLPRLKTVFFNPIGERYRSAERREVESIVRKRMPEMSAANMLRFPE
ncbi:uncharacterized protein PHACADRAFT_262476 [Phanerochaete carnosa HHB-10118-sp]|uniref:Uncharacterized protein n=1 Tax=Phanerochaete carnosa (strain HHB-10118-sp) TaxID=650164 RepID=K5WNX1_PHACS|nr:uncharacterized protein PHACADRAFT_262476 [Phanerochaete carnosa HHB-10118-sp]EKM52022.1 hypothetical protein PHACADRAFT_262476 [Phanerochaete carnosa HHB-10118-sp]